MSNSHDITVKEVILYEILGPDGDLICEVEVENENHEFLVARAEKLGVSLDSLIVDILTNHLMSEEPASEAEEEEPETNEN